MRACLIWLMWLMWLALLPGVSYCQTGGGLPGMGSTASGGTTNTFTLIQHNAAYDSNGTTTYTFTPTSAIGTGHLAVLIVTNSSNQNRYLTAVSGGGTWVIPTAATPNGCQASTASGSSISCAYNLNTSSTSSLALTFSTASNYGVQIVEYSFTLGSTSLDNIGSAVDSSSSTTLNGVAPSLTGTKDVIIQAIVGSATSGGPSSIDHSYGNLLTLGNTYAGTADLENTVSSATPVWTWSAANTGPVCYLAFQ